MFTNKKAKYNGDNNVLIDAACLSTDTKPTTGIANGSKCIEMDTGKTFMFNEEDSEWEELPSSGGGGGGSSDFSTVEVTLIGNNGSFSVYTERDEEYYPFRYQCFFRIGNQLTFDESPLAENETPLILTLYYLGNSCVCYPNNTCTSATGDVVFDSDNNTLTITGDCTITGYIAD